MQVCCLDIPADWICESCFPSGMVLPEAGGKKVTEKTLSIDSSNIACHDKICTAGLNSFFFSFSYLLNELLSLKTHYAYIDQKQKKDIYMKFNTSSNNCRTQHQTAS
jgi:hypothetical protein